MSAKNVVSDIRAYNEASAELVNNRLMAYTMGGGQNRYLPESLTVDEVMEGMDYAKVESKSQLESKWLGVVSEANSAFRAAIQDGTHIKNSSTDPGVLELTKLRQNSDSPSS